MESLFFYEEFMTIPCLCKFLMRILGKMYKMVLLSVKMVVLSK